jgi:hypothetical protein
MISNRPNGPCSAVRGNQHRLARQLTKCEPRRRFLSNRVINNWNKVPSEIVNSNTVMQFKKRYDDFSEATNKKSNLLL